MFIYLKSLAHHERYHKDKGQEMANVEPKSLDRTVSFVMVPVYDVDLDKQIKLKGKEMSTLCE
jgi:hypothetical protein